MTDQCTGVVPVEIQEIAAGQRVGLCPTCGGLVSVHRYGTLRGHVNMRLRESRRIRRRTERFTGELEEPFPYDEGAI